MKRTQLALGPLLIALVLTAQAALAAGSGGQIAIFRETTAGDEMTAGGDSFTHDWDTTERIDATVYSLSGGSSILCKAGHYLVLYSTR